MCIGFVWQCFGSRAATGTNFVRSCQKLPPGPTEPMPAGSKMDLLLAKGEPISTSGITYLNRGKKPLHNSNCSRRVE